MSAPDALASSFCEMTSCDIATAKYYLSMAQNDVNVAIGLYFDSGGAPAPTGAEAATSVLSLPQRVEVHWSSGVTFSANKGTMSQFSFEDGRSACTTIACEASMLLLEHDSVEKTVGTEISDPDFVLKVVTEGVNQYRAQNAERSGGVEHQSCHEVLLANKKYSETLESCGYEQSNTSIPNAFCNELKRALETSKNCGGLCCVITKPPETMVVGVHPPTGAFPQGHFTVFDSHPRPSLMFQGAFMVGFNSADATASFLREIFPAVEGLGSSMMAQMYNSFDMTMLRKKKATE
jgi:hypothetical protein